VINEKGKRKRGGMEKGTERDKAGGDDRTNHVLCRLQINQRSFSTRVTFRRYLCLH